MIIQGLIRLKEKKVKIRCREADAGIVSGVLDAAAKEYSAIMQRDASIQVETKLSLDKKRHLEAAW